MRKGRRLSKLAMRFTIIYNYLPKIGRTIKVSGALRAGSWMGSHFTNDDLVKASSIEGDYAASILKKNKVAGKEVWDVELIPKDKVAVPWNKIHVRLNVADSIPIRQEFFDEKGKTIRTITYDQLKVLGGREVPAIIRVTPGDRESEFTELNYRSIERNIKLDGDFFSLSRLKNL
jgi:hypothetical protein